MNPRISLRHLEAFNAVMVTGSITGAATMLHVSQPAVSATIKHFEQRLGFAIFERRSGRLVPTAEAGALLPDVQEIFGRIAALDRYSQDLAAGAHGSLSIAATAPIANALLARAVASFIAHRPQAHIALLAMDSNLIAERLLNGQVDLGVAFEPGNNEALVSQPLNTSELACVLPVDHPLTRLDAIDIDALRPYPVISYVPQALLRQRLKPYLNQPLNISVEVVTSMTAIVLAVHGAGIALVEPSMLRAMPTPSLTERPLKPSVKVASHIMWASHRPQTALARAFVGHLRGLVMAETADETAPPLADNGAE